MRRRHRTDNQAAVIKAARPRLTNAPVGKEMPVPGPVWCAGSSGRVRKCAVWTERAGCSGTSARWGEGREGFRAAGGGVVIVTGARVPACVGEMEDPAGPDETWRGQGMAVRLRTALVEGIDVRPQAPIAQFPLRDAPQAVVDAIVRRAYHDPPRRCLRRLLCLTRHRLCEEW
ncbi:hypothetical protein SVIO_102440 [Streptomyces violaceusniger]|uniref:Uncharacterized protein n=1 Tax=Streptomyces violaceusniger TaxID=68280 RepID=A0A4D4LDG7_STRVO|nr:hypothetical protein SVIO_102440 [Streptomyces violaceusniger]